MEPIRTVGHGTLDSEALTELLVGVGVGTLVDIRRYPGSRRNPQFGEEAMARWLPDAGITYERIAELGGRRKPVPESPNTAWRNEQFAAYADHMATTEFATGVAQLLEPAGGSPTAIMCSEAVWWRCHRRMVADHLVLVEGIPVEHLFHDGRSVGHDPMAEAVVVGQHVEYPASATEHKPG